jgi:tetratricopeptide (TPR) repeat protein
MIKPGTRIATRIAAQGLPGFVYFLMVLAGPWPFLPYLSRSPSRLFRALMIAAAIAPLPAVALLPFNWLFLSILLAVWNLLWSLAAMAVMPMERSAPSGVPAYRRLRTSLALALAALPMAVFLASMEQWLSDLLWSSYYPVNASVDSISAELGSVWLNFGLLLFFSALQSTKEGEGWSLSGLLGLILLVTGAHVFVNQLHLVLITIPLWQVEDLTIFPPWLDRTRQILFFVMWFSSIPLLVHHCLRLWRTGRKFAGSYFIGLLSVGLAMVGLAVVTGLPINYALVMGQHYEKSGTPEKAIPWYSKALSWSRSDNLKSYLQFRVALLHRKSGNLEESKEAFIRVLVKYYHDSRILLEAHEFRDKLEKDRDSTLKRVVIPGIEARTEYKSAYCVPNSLGLVLNYWGDRSGAKRIGAEITQLDRGSLITDEAFFSESRGFANLVLPLRSMNDIFRLIDNGIPVLAFIPGHVIAIFGYDQVLQTLVVYDVNTYDIWDDQRWSVFGQDWSHMFNTMAIVIPKAKLPELKKILGPDIVAHNEAYLQFLMARMNEDDIDRRALHLGRSAGHGFFFADWEYENLIGKRPIPAVKDSVIAGFLIGHDVYESQILEYLQSLYQRGDYARAITFIERYRKQNRLSSGLATLLSGCYHRMGDSEKAVEVLLGYIDLDEQEPVTLEFLLGQEYVQEDPETARRIALKLLDSEDKIPGSTADLAFWTWRKHTTVDFRNIDEALAVMENYLAKWNPYDRQAIGELLEAFKLKTFRPDDEFNQRGWEKKIRIYRNRMESGA